MDVGRGVSAVILMEVTDWRCLLCGKGAGFVGNETEGSSLRKGQDLMVWERSAKESGARILEGRDTIG